VVWDLINNDEMSLQYAGIGRNDRVVVLVRALCSARAAAYAG